jgi:hypothetical protein
VYAPSVSQAQILDFMRKAVAEVAPSGYQVDYPTIAPMRAYPADSS